MIDAEPTAADVAMLRAELASALRTVEQIPDELFGRQDLFEIADRLAGELSALVHAAQPAVSLPRRAPWWARLWDARCTKA